LHLINDFNADPNVQTLSGDNIIGHCVSKLADGYQGTIVSLIKLINSGLFDINQKNDVGLTPLYSYLLSDSSNYNDDNARLAVKSFIKQGADVQLKFPDGYFSGRGRVMNALLYCEEENHALLGAISEAIAEKELQSSGERGLDISNALGVSGLSR